MITQIFNIHSIKILSLFSLSPGSKFNRKEIQERTKINNVPLDKTLTSLLYSNIIKREKNYYYYDFENEFTNMIIKITQKQFKLLKELPLNVYYNIIELTEFFSNKKDIELYLFGSYAKLIYSEKSDIDIAIITNKKLNRIEINRLIDKLENTYNKEIEIHYFEKKTFYKNKSDPLIKSILKNGVKLV